MVDIRGLDKAALLAALYNGARQQGVGQHDPRGALPLAVDDARAVFGDGKFDYLHGRVLKVDLRGDELETQWYNRDNGAGAAEAVVELLREQDNVAALKALCLQLGNAMAQAVVNSPLSPRGVMFCAAIALHGFTKGARQIEGWSAEQTDGYLAEALADAAVDIVTFMPALTPDGGAGA